MEQFLWAYWWLIFPIMGFGFGAFGMWMNYRRQRDLIDLMKTLAAQGKDPAEIGKFMDAAGARQPDWNGMGAGAHGWGGAGWDGRRYRSPLREWKQFVTFLCLAVGFGLAAWYAPLGGGEQAFVIVTIVMGMAALGSLVMALIATSMARRLNGPEK